MFGMDTVEGEEKIYMYSIMDERADYKNGLITDYTPVQLEMHVLDYMNPEVVVASEEDKNIGRNFANPENWGGVESTSYDIQNDTYVIKAYTMGKFLLGYQRQDQTVTIKGNGNSFTINVTDVTSANCDKNGKITSNPLPNQAPTCL